MRASWGVELQLHSVLDWAIDGGEWSHLLPGRFASRNKAVTWRLGGLQRRSESVGGDKNMLPCQDSNPS